MWENVLGFNCNSASSAQNWNHVSNFGLITIFAKSGKGFLRVSTFIHGYERKIFFIPVEELLKLLFNVQNLDMFYIHNVKILNLTLTSPKEMMYLCNFSGAIHYLTTRASLLLMMCLSVFRFIAIKKPTYFSSSKCIMVLTFKLFIINIYHYHDSRHKNY